eukprot:356188-Chlamydomonas_euryale.AAC.14
MLARPQPTQPAKHRCNCRVTHARMKSHMHRCNCRVTHARMKSHMHTACSCTDMQGPSPAWSRSRCQPSAGQPVPEGSAPGCPTLAPPVRVSMTRCGAEGTAAHPAAP